MWVIITVLGVVVFSDEIVKVSKWCIRRNKRE